MSEYGHYDESFNFRRFVAAQSGIYDTALAEIRSRRKRTHWMWFVFPQLRGLGTSDAAILYAIGSIDEAKAYLAHPVLGARLVECTVAMCAGPETDPQQILGEVDAAKFRSCMTLFERVGDHKQCFAFALQKFFGGCCDAATTRILQELTDAR